MPNYNQIVKDIEIETEHTEFPCGTYFVSSFNHDILHN